MSSSAGASAAHYEHSNFNIQSSCLGNAISGVSASCHHSAVRHQDCMSHFMFHTYFMYLDVFFLLFSGLRFPHGVRPRQLLCWRRPRWFSTSSDLWLFSLMRYDTISVKASRREDWRSTLRGPDLEVKRKHRTATSYAS